ncbi:MAG: hypothetical protein IPO11_13955 [Betaproteobacteria bacterium]|nr:hypothetical protein [Betaproteobacteria bacterium]
MPAAQAGTLGWPGQIRTIRAFQEGLTHLQPGLRIQTFTDLHRHALIGVIKAPKLARLRRNESLRLTSANQETAFAFLEPGAHGLREPFTRFSLRGRSPQLCVEAPEILLRALRKQRDNAVTQQVPKRGPQADRIDIVTQDVQRSRRASRQWPGVNELRTAKPLVAAKAIQKNAGAAGPSGICNGQTHRAIGNSGKS